MLKLVVDNTKKVAEKLRTIAEERAKKASQQLMERDRAEMLKGLEGDPDYWVSEDYPIVLRVVRQSDDQEMFRFLTLNKAQDPVTPYQKILDRGFYVDIVHKQERVLAGNYGSLVMSHLLREKFALIVSRYFWRCKCAEVPVKGPWVTECPECGAKPGDARHELRFVDNMI